MTDTLTVKKNANGKWFWHRSAANNRIISTSGETFEDKTAAATAARRANPDMDMLEFEEGFLDG